MITLLALILCTVSSIHCLSQAKAFKPKKVVFQHITKIDSTGFDAFDLMIDTEIGKTDNPTSDTLALAFKIAARSMLGQLDNDTSLIIIELLNDTIWRSNERKGETVGNYERIEPNGLMFTHAKDRNEFLPQPFNIFEKVKSGILTINKKDKKKLLGFRCYKAIIEIPEPGEDFGNNVFEMYVTKKIKLPTHAIVYVDKEYPFFPLEIKSYQKNMAGLISCYQAISIEK